ncbi:MAG: stage II sporulation protein M [Clostridia bacterium]|nr:stage II sporulation protein M [Clostridia bacterium]
MLFSLASLFLQNIIVIPIILMLNVSALRLYRTLIQKNREMSIKGEVARHTLLCLFLIIPLIFASLVEAYISSSLICLYH